MTFVVFSPAFSACEDLLNFPQGLVIATEPQNLADAIHAIPVSQAAAQPVKFFLGTSQTSVFCWFAAQQSHPQAQLWCLQVDGLWIELKSQHTLQHAALLAHIAPPPHDLAKTSEVTPIASVTEPAQDVPAPTPIADEHRKQLIQDVYLVYAWGKDDADRVLQEAKEQFPEQLDTLKELDKAARHGQLASNLGNELKVKVQSGEDETAINTWIKSQKNLPYRVKFHLEKTLKKLKERQKTQRAKFNQRRAFDITMPQYQLSAGVHHHSLRNLAPAQSWQIFIDETGTRFDQGALELSLKDINLGKILALVLPEQHNLPKLESPIHATDLPHLQIEGLFQQLMNSNCGIFGASVHDLTTYNWMGAIAKLTRWALLMLPISGETRVRVFIEQRAPYAKTDQLKAFCDTLENELKLLAPEKFSQLHLSLEIMEKSNPFNGYVDVIANAWGSSDPIKAKLLNRTLWRGHCLLEKVDLDNIEKFYQRCSYQENLTTSDWFTLCTLVSTEPEHSFLQHLSNQQRLKTAENPKLWRDYLHEVSYRIASKNYTPASLRAALNWLDACRGEQSLPAPLLLQQLSLQQAADNHIGLCDIEKSQQILKLAKQLRDEIPKEACEASLRVAISSTHLMDFTKSVPFLTNWLEQPVAVPGLLNFGKLHSTLGQLAAFRQEYAGAHHHFELALEAFSRLSDPSQVQKEQQQTRTYQAIAWLDEGNAKADAAMQHILALDADLENGKAFTKLAKSGDSQRFSHYLLLRWLICQPQRTAMRRRYLEVMTDWQIGEDHPWMLINAYRGWLLAENDQPTLAADYFQQAIDDCVEADSVLLQWMGHVLAALSQSLQLPCQINRMEKWPSYLPAEQLTELAKAQHNHVRVHCLQQLLPFNFH